jgi:large subunit ribosomal protein L19|uniref:ribosomal protein L19 n=1 Tax=Cryptomonas gyropyrenoidosa TaxID=233257 RepID=UPI0027A1EC50|nr:ribosomal protein L19 [Cryptomonas gyropyrenoidosa]WFQ83040.1 ribosomal protein L19 [Cryptomonas gyropyrenoidosa]
MEIKIQTSELPLVKIQNKFLNSTLPVIKVGDTIKLGVSILEGNKERVQFNEGVIIAVKNSGLNKTITLRRVLQGVGVERVYLIHSPKIKSVEIIRRSSVRRAKLYYLRLRVGKATRLQQKFE